MFELHVQIDISEHDVVYDCRNSIDNKYIM